MNSAWLTIITMTTVGYGDLYPKTFAGRFFGVMSFIVGNMMISLMVVALSSKTAFSMQEVKAYNTMKKQMAIDRVNNKAADVIKTLFIYSRFKRAS